jgi:trk system potassium uptake protein TrkA
VSTSKRVLVIGLGRFGIALARELWDLGAELILVDRDESTLDEMKSFSHAAFVADATDIRALETAGIADVDAAAVALGDSFEAAVLAVSALSKWGVPNIVARATTSERASVLRSVGATRVHEVETEMGQRAALLITSPVAPDLLDLANQFRVIPWNAQGSIVGKKVSESGLRQKYEINILGIRPCTGGGRGALQQPRADYTIQADDTLLLVGEEHLVSQFVADME